MKEFLSAIIIGIAVNLDNLILAINYSNKKTVLSWKYNVLISSITVIMTLLTLAIGNHIFRFIDKNWSSIISGVTLIILGIIYLFPCVFKKFNKKEEKCKKLDIQGILGISLILSINNLPTALAYSIDGSSIFLLSTIFFLCSTLFIYLGSIIAKNVSVVYTNALSSILLIIIGITEICIK